MHKSTLIVALLGRRDLDDVRDAFRNGFIQNASPFYNLAFRIFFYAIFFSFRSEDTFTILRYITL